ncbi:MAG: hypothetical protein H6644_01405 [Caldilineaceae bacterium]|nr:hypothetical protein [Caldilineaceae bacterium]
MSTGVTTTTEAGGSFAISYTLTSAPTAAVVLTVASGDTRARPPSRLRKLTFDAETWDQPQSVTVTGADDDVADGDVAFSVTTSVASDDPVYDGFTVADIDAVNQDDDCRRHRRRPPASRPRPRRAAASPSATR